MIAKYNKISLAVGIPGIIVQFAGILLGELGAPGVPVALLGTGLLLVGLVYYTKAKARSPAWCLMAFLSLIGLIVLACLKDKSVAA